MENVFAYFFSIGAGTSLGITIGCIPALLVRSWWLKRKGGLYTNQTKKARA